MIKAQQCGKRGMILNIIKDIMTNLQPTSYSLGKTKSISLKIRKET